MHIQKLTADHIFTGKGEFLREHVIVIDSTGRILAIEDISDHDPLGVQSFEGLICPGFINSHCHLELSHTKGLLAEKEGLTNFLFQIINVRKADTNVILEAIMEAENEMINAGIVAVGDISNGVETIVPKQSNRLVYHSFIECLGGGLDPARASLVFENTLKTYQEYTNGGLSASLVPHASYTSSPALMKRLCDFNYPAGMPMSIHMQEHAEEDRFFLKGDGAFARFYEAFGDIMARFNYPGLNALEYSLSGWKPEGKLMLVHNTYTSPGHLEFTAALSKEIYWCFCPNANLYIENRLPELDNFSSLNERLLLGTDSLASNWSLSVLDEIKSINKHFPQLPLSKPLQWASSNAATFFGWEDLGSLAAGRKPGINLISGIDVDKNKIPDNCTIKRLL